MPPAPLDERAAPAWNPLESLPLPLPVRPTIPLKSPEADGDASSGPAGAAPRTEPSFDPSREARCTKVPSGCNSTSATSTRRTCRRFFDIPRLDRLRLNGESPCTRWRGGDVRFRRLNVTAGRRIGRKLRHAILRGAHVPRGSLRPDPSESSAISTSRASPRNDATRRPAPLALVPANDSEGRRLRRNLLSALRSSFFPVSVDSPNRSSGSNVSIKQHVQPIFAFKSHRADSAFMYLK